MTLEHAIKPIMRDGKRVVLNESDFKILEAGYIKSCIADDLRVAKQQIAEGNCFKVDEVLAELDDEYGYVVV